MQKRRSRRNKASQWQRREIREDSDDRHDQDEDEWEDVSLEALPIMPEDEQLPDEEFAIVSMPALREMLHNVLQRTSIRFIPTAVVRLVWSYVDDTDMLNGDAPWDFILPHCHGYWIDHPRVCRLLSWDKFRDCYEAAFQQLPEMGQLARFADGPFDTWTLVPHLDLFLHGHGVHIGFRLVFQPDQYKRHVIEVWRSMMEEEEDKDVMRMPNDAYASYHYEYPQLEVDYGLDWSSVFPKRNRGNYQSELYGPPSRPPLQGTDPPLTFLLTRFAVSKAPPMPATCNVVVHGSNP